MVLILNRNSDFVCILLQLHLADGAFVKMRIIGEEANFGTGDWVVPPPPGDGVGPLQALEELCASFPSYCK